MIPDEEFIHWVESQLVPWFMENVIKPLVVAMSAFLDVLRELFQESCP